MGDNKSPLIIAALRAEREARERAEAMVAAAYQDAADLIQRVAAGYSSIGDARADAIYFTAGNVASLTPADAKAALDRMLQQAADDALGAEVKVKPLSWFGPEPCNSSVEYEQHTANPPFGEITANHIAFWFDGEHSTRCEGGLKAVKLAAQAEYEARIIAALETAPCVQVIAQMSPAVSAANPDDVAGLVDRLLATCQNEHTYDADKDDAAALIKYLTARIAAMESDRPFIVGANHGYEAAMQQVAAAGGPIQKCIDIIDEHYDSLLAATARAFLHDSEDSHG